MSAVGKSQRERVSLCMHYVWSPRVFTLPRIYLALSPGILASPPWTYTVAWNQPATNGNILDDKNVPRSVG